MSKKAAELNKNTQSKAIANASPRTAAPVQKTLSPPPLQLKATEDTTEGKESLHGSSIFTHTSGDIPNDSNNNPTQTKLAPFSAPQKSIVQKKKGSSTPFSPNTATSSNNNGLSAPVQAKMEQAFNADFSNVNIHKNSKSATDMGALAYAQGNDVHFAPGQFKQDTQAGQELIGHELAHVVQQRQGRVKATTQAKGMPVNDNPGLEREADEMGRKAAQMKVNTSVSPSNLVQGDSGSSNVVQRVHESGGGGGGRSYSTKPSENKTEFDSTLEVSKEFSTDSGWTDPDGEGSRTGIVYKKIGVNLRAKPDSNKNLAIRRLAQNEKVSIIKHNRSKNWYAVITENHEIGYVNDGYIFINLPEPNAKIKQIDSGDTALGLAMKSYGAKYNPKSKKYEDEFSDSEWDNRFVVNALVYANNLTPQNGKGNKGISKPKGNNDLSWATTKLTTGVYIWIPSSKFVKSLKGNENVESGSITAKLWNAAVEVLNDAAFSVSFLAGTLHGAFDGFIEMVAGAVEGLWDIIKSLFAGTILEDLKKIIEFIKNLTWKDLKEMLFGWMKPWIEKAEKGNTLERGHAYGYITGRILFEVLSLFISGGAVLKIIGKCGKLGKKIKTIIDNVKEVIDKKTGPAKQKIEELRENVKTANAALLKKGVQAARRLKFPTPHNYKWTKTSDGSLLIINDVGDTRYWDVESQSFNGLNVLSNKSDKIFKEYKDKNSNGNITKKEVENKLTEGQILLSDPVKPTFVPINNSNLGTNRGGMLENPAAMSMVSPPKSPASTIEKPTTNNQAPNTSKNTNDVDKSKDTVDDEKAHTKTDTNWSKIEGLIGKKIKTTNDKGELEIDAEVKQILEDEYIIYDRKDGKTIIQRKVADDDKFVQLTVDEKGKIQLSSNRPFDKKAELLDVDEDLKKGNQNYPQLDEEVRKRKELLDKGDKSSRQKAKLLSELIGLKAADAYMKKLGYTRVNPLGDLKNQVPGKTGEFDLIYEKDGNFVIVEAKGGSGSLGGRSVDGEFVQQGTKPYLDDLLAKLKTTDKQLHKKLSAASRKNQLDYFLTRQRFKINGEKGKFSIDKFKI